MPGAPQVAAGAAAVPPPRPADLGLVALGGALGGPARYAVEGLLSPAGVGGPGGGLPGGTVAVNLAGALLLGVLVGAGGWGRRRVLLLVGTGFAGAFTTFSTWVLEVVRLAPDRPVVAVAHLLGLLVVGTAVAAAGVRLGRRTLRPVTPDPHEGLR